MPIQPIIDDPRAEHNLKLYRKDRDARIASGWDDKAREDIDFWLGNPYSIGESQQKKNWGQDDPSIDRVYAGIEKFKSLLTARNPKYRIVGRENSDQRMAFVRQSIVDYVWDISTGSMRQRRALHDYSTTGLGYMYVYLDKDADYGLGDIKITDIGSFRVYVPLTTSDRFHENSAYQTLSTILPAEELTWMFSELGWVSTDGKLNGLIADLAPYSEDDYPASLRVNTVGSITPDKIRDIDPSTLRYQILERFYKVKVPFIRVFNQETGEKWILSEDQYNVFSEMVNSIPGAKNLEEVEITQTRIGHNATIGNTFLYEEILNTDIYPIVPFPNVDVGTVLPDSDITRVKDPQLLLNRIFSLVLLHAQNSAGLKLIYPKGAFDNEDDVETLWAQPNVALPFNPAAGGKPEAFQPIPLSGEFYQLINQLSFQIDFLLGIPEILHGFPEKVPETASQTVLLSDFAQGRPKSKLQDIEFSLGRLGRVVHNYAMGHYPVEKLFSIAQANNDREGIMEGFYDDRSEAIMAIDRDRVLSQYDVRFQGGSTLPNDELADLNMWRELYKDGLATKKYVWRAHPALFNARELDKEFGEISTLLRENAGLKDQVKKLGGDLQTTQREALHARLDKVVSKYETAFNKILAETEAGRKIEVSKLRELQKALKKEHDVAVREIALAADTITKQITAGEGGE